MLGSRFAALEDLLEPETQEETMETEENVEVVRLRQAQVAGKDSKAKGKAKLTLDDDMTCKDEVTLNVYHIEITNNLKGMSKPGVAEPIRVVSPYGEPKRTEKKLLKDISNRLEAQPVITKTNRSGLRNVFGEIE